MKHILIVDDEKDLAEMIQQMRSLSLKGERVRVHVTASPGEAYIKASNQKFDLIISDLRMPKTNGAELVTSIRKMKHNTQTPLIMISGYPEEAQKMVSHLPQVSVVAKPFDFNDFNDFADSVEKILGFSESKAA
jgi:CheY-like chemotaxis protein